MAWTTPDEIAALFRSRGSAQSDQDEKSWRTAQLKEVLAAAREQNADGLAPVVEKLADGARDATWRLPLGDSGLVEFVLSAAPAQDPQHPLTKQSLRLLGNACADCDENRARVVESGSLFGFVMDCLEHDALLPFAIATALNVCVDYSPAQLQASKAGLSKVLVDLVSGDRLSACRASLSHIMTILELLCGQDPEPKMANPHTPALLLRLATSERYDADLDSFMEICSPALAYLTFQDLQPVFLESSDSSSGDGGGGGGLELLQTAFLQLYTRFDTASGPGSSPDLDPDTASQLKQVGDAFLALFADISALPSFPAACPLDSKAAQTLVGWLRLPPRLSHPQTAACLSLGNLSRSDEASTALLARVQEPLLDTLARAIPPTTRAELLAAPDGGGGGGKRPPAPPPQLTHAALSFLKNLAIPAANKARLGRALLEPVSLQNQQQQQQQQQAILPRLWTTTRTQPQLQFAAVSLARLLVVNCAANARRMCAPVGQDQGQGQSQSYLAQLASTAASADEQPIKLEAARAASQVCRALHSTTATCEGEEAEDTEQVLDPSWTWAQPDTTPTTTASSARARFYAAHTQLLASAFALLLTQPRFPALRSDAIFVLALMSRTADGARQALCALQHNHGNDGARTGAGAGAGGNEDDGKKRTAWHVVAEAIAGPEGAELLQAVAGSRGVVVATGRGGKGNKERKSEEEATLVDRLTLEPQQVDAQAQRQQQSAETAKRDRENAMVLVAELLRRFPNELSTLKAPLEAVLRKGGELVVQDRDQEQR